MSVKFTSKGLADGTDDTKELEFNVAGVTTGNTRVITVPDSNLTLAGTDVAQTFTADQSLGDNVKAKFGASDDLQIYHDGDSSYISHNTTGTDLIIEATSPGDDVIVRAADDLNFRVNGNENGIVAVGGGATSLYHANAAKLTTTSTGIDVTGSVTADGLTVDGDANISGITTLARVNTITGTLNLNSGSTATLAIPHGVYLLTLRHVVGGSTQHLASYVTASWWHSSPSFWDVYQTGGDSYITASNGSYPASSGTMNLAIYNGSSYSGHDINYTLLRLS